MILCEFSFKEQTFYRKHFSCLIHIPSVKRSNSEEISVNFAKLDKKQPKPQKSCMNLTMNDATMMDLPTVCTQCKPVYIEMYSME